MVNAYNSAFHRSRAAFCRVRVNISATVLLRGMTDRAVSRVLWPDAAISGKFVCHMVRPSVHFFSNRLFDCFCGHICYYATAQLPVAFHSQNTGVLLVPRPRLLVPL